MEELISCELKCFTCGLYLHDPMSTTFQPQVLHPGLKRKMDTSTSTYIYWGGRYLRVASHSRSLLLFSASSHRKELSSKASPKCDIFYSTARLCFTLWFDPTLFLSLSSNFLCTWSTAHFKSHFISFFESLLNINNDRNSCDCIKHTEANISVLALWIWPLIALLHSVTSDSLPK